MKVCASCNFLEETLKSEKKFIYMDVYMWDGWWFQRLYLDENECLFHHLYSIEESKCEHIYFIIYILYKHQYVCILNKNQCMCISEFVLYIRTCVCVCVCVSACIFYVRIDVGVCISVIIFYIRINVCVCVYFSIDILYKNQWYVCVFQHLYSV